MTAANAYVMLNRLRGQVDRSLGALLIARMGRDDCEDLDALLADWDGTFSPLIRKRVARHVENCETCSERRKKIVSPWMLLAGVPAFVAPLGLRDRVVNDTQLVAFHVPGSGAGGASVARTHGTGRRRAALAAAAVLIAGSVVTTAVVWPDGDTDPISAVPTPTATVGSTGSAVTATPTPSTSPSVSASPTPTASSPALTPGSLALSTTSIDLGSTATTGKVGLSNTGDETVTFEITSVPAWLTVSPGSLSIPGDLATSLRVTADRSKVAEGATSGDVVIAWSGRTSVVTVSLVQENNPVVGRPSAVGEAFCSFPVSADVSDESRLTSVVLSWSGAYTGTATMQRNGSSWVTPELTFDNDATGNVVFRVTATDSRGNTTVGPTRTYSDISCPNPG